jgi:hypothetical protein
MTLAKEARIKVKGESTAVVGEEASRREEEESEENPPMPYW